jgi:hypothetical protein
MSTTCCPLGYVYIDYEGIYNDPSPEIGTGVLSNSDWDPFLEKCVKLVNIVLSSPVGSAYALSPAVEPNECTKCCPENYTYSSYTGLCESGSPALPAVITVPCVPCVCPEVVPFECSPCGTDGEPIVFELNTHSKECTTCTPQDQNNPPGMSTFVATPFLDPITSNFKLRNKNLI